MLQAIHQEANFQMNFINETCDTGRCSEARDNAVSSCYGEPRLHRIDRCPICKGSRLRTIGRTRTIHPAKELELDLMGCASCLHWFISPAPLQNELTRLYENCSEYVVSAGGQPDRKRFSIPEKYIIRAESRDPRKRKKYLEVGIGRGLLLDYFKSVGYNCFGVDPGPWAQGAPDVVKDITRLDQTGFDVIVMANVLEHVEDPLSLVKSIGDRIETGTVYACFPNSQSLRARLSKGRWRMVRPLGHLHFFSRRSLSITFESNGFNVKRLAKTDLIEFRCRSLFKPVHLFPVNLFLSVTERFWGDQWIVQLEK